MSRSNHHSTTILADHVNFIHESTSGNADSNVALNTNGLFHMLKPLIVPSVLLDEYKIIKNADSLIIQKKEEGVYRTLMSIS